MGESRTASELLVASSSISFIAVGRTNHFDGSPAEDSVV